MQCILFHSVLTQRIIQGLPEVQCILGLLFHSVLTQLSVDYPRMVRGTMYSWITFPQCSDPTVCALSKDGQRYNVLLDYFSTVFHPRNIQGQPETQCILGVLFHSVLTQPTADYPWTAGDTMYSWITFPDPTVRGLSKDGQRCTLFLDYFSTVV